MTQSLSHAHLSDYLYLSIENMFSPNLNLDKALRDLIFEPKVQFLKRTTQPVFIWTMGKVGSTSIAKALYDVKGISVFTTHFMNDPAHPRSQALYKHLIKPKPPLKIISLVRDPISKNVSSFFQNYEKNTGRKYAEGDLSMAEVNDLFFNRYQHHRSPLTWFDNYIERYTGIDVFAQPFSPETKSAQYKHDSFELLLMRCDLEDEKKAQNVESFLGLESGSFKIVSQNVGDSKDYSKLYREFKSQVQFPAEYLDEMTQSKYFRHFYSPEEIKSLTEKWLTAV